VITQRKRFKTIRNELYGSFNPCKQKFGAVAGLFKSDKKIEEKKQNLGPDFAHFLI